MPIRNNDSLHCKSTYDSGFLGEMRLLHEGHIS